jgi:hypothetical protein
VIAESYTAQKLVYILVGPVNDPKAAEAILPNARATRVISADPFAGRE